MEATGAALSPTANVLIVRLSAIGDCLETLPMACALKDRYPRCHITWVVERSAAPLLRGHWAIDDLLELPKGWAKSPKVIWRLRQMLRRRRYEIAFDPQGLSKSAGVAWMAGACRRVGLASPYGRELSLWLNQVLIRPVNEHVVDRQLEMLQTVGVRWPTVRFDVPVCPESTKSVAAWLETPRFVNGFLVINPGATWDSKLWPADRYGEVAATVAARWRLPSVVVWAGPRERQWADEIAACSAGAATVAPPTTLPNWRRSYGERRSTSAPTPVRCTWPPPLAHRASDSSVPRDRKTSARTAPITSPSRRTIKLAPVGSAAPLRTTRCGRSLAKWYSRRSADAWNEPRPCARHELRGVERGVVDARPLSN